MSAVHRFRFCRRVPFRQAVQFFDDEDSFLDCWPALTQAPTARLGAGHLPSGLPQRPIAGRLGVQLHLLRIWERQHDDAGDALRVARAIRKGD